LAFHESSCSGGALEAKAQWKLQPLRKRMRPLPCLIGI
jgi:hypothetical protein